MIDPGTFGHIIFDLEFLLGQCVVLGVLHRTSAFLIAGLNGLFMVALGSVMARGIVVDCGSFGLLADVLHLPIWRTGKRSYGILS